MDAELKRVHSPDVIDLENFQPNDPKKFNILVQALVGPKAEDGEESFSIEVCTPRWLEETYGVHEVIVGRHFLIVQEYDYKRLVGAIEKFVRGCSGEDWHDIATKVSQLGLWEFENYAERS